MATDSIFADLYLTEEGVKVLAEMLKELGDVERPDSAGTAPDPCLTKEEVYELLKDVDVLGP